MSYRSISLFDTGAPSSVWELPGPISRDTAAGFLVGLLCMISKSKETLALKMVDFSGKTSFLRLNVDNRGDTKDRLALLINKYLEHRSVPYHELKSYYCRDGHYGWWIKDPVNSNPSQPTYNLYCFKTNDFVEGFISAFDMFDVEFRDYIAGPPFRTEVGFNGVKKNTFYIIEGYDIRPLSQSTKDPAPVGPFYTGSYQEFIDFAEVPHPITDQTKEEYPQDFN